ncbi:MAG: lipopolysaccharide transport periplasmic protein LptA [Betaproteobacteria bacterium RIFCSPLOWO2_02_FULL_67_26]|nr:MAG: lipopolysaccharide transport periplasmic protein LptA [Betaproteobacteria bacterium RIFCSPLOWO2_02_FULL_67_26]
MAVTTHRFLSRWALACCALLAVAGPLRAERADREKPVNLEADRVTIDDARQTALFEGNVLLTQGTMQLRGDRMEVRQDKEGFRLGTTWGKPAYFRQKREGYDEYVEGWAERIEYDGRAETMRMFDRAQLKRGPDEVRGNTISYDARTEFFQVTGGGAKAAAPNNPEGRVRAVIQPKPKDKPGAAPPVSLKPAESIAAPREEAGTRIK